MKLLREPLLHFLFIGAAIYLLYGLFAAPIPKSLDNTIVVSTGEIEWMKSSWQKRWNRAPTAEELDGLTQQYIKETVLYREALTMGLDKHDPVIRRRLAQKLEFLAKDLVALTPPTESELQAYFDQHQQRYTKPALFSFAQIYINPDKRGDTTMDDAKQIKEKLIEEGEHQDLDLSSLGDDFMLQTFYSEKSQAEIQKLFGIDFAESLGKLSSGQWHGPILSGFGVHLIYVSNIVESPTPIFSKVRARVLRDWSTEKSDELNEQFYASLLDRYTIVLEQPIEKDDLAVISEKTP